MFEDATSEENDKTAVLPNDAAMNRNVDVTSFFLFVNLTADAANDVGGDGMTDAVRSQQSFCFYESVSGRFGGVVFLCVPSMMFD